MERRERLEALEEECKILRERLELERMFALPDDRN
jgi:hypothetical protein